MSYNKLLSSFSSKIGKLLEDDDDEYNIIIRVGEEPNIKHFKAHSIILRAISPYFRDTCKNVKKKEDNLFYIEKSNISPSIFEVILRFIYTGTISMENRNSTEITKLLEAAQELKLNELVGFLKEHLIQYRDLKDQKIHKSTTVTDSCLIQSPIHLNNSRESSRSLRRRGKIQLVGSGPGDPNLLTLAAYQAMQEADVILSDKLVPSEVLKLIPSHIEVLIAAKKFCANVEASQAELNRLGLEALNQGKKVVRLKQGDPFLFGRGGEEFLFYRSNGYIPQVIPGISSCMSAPLLANIPVTHRGVASQFLVCTGTGRKNTLPEIPTYHPYRTTVFLMACHRIRQITQDLMKEGNFPAECPCVIIEKASCVDQNVIKGTIGTIADILERVGHNPPGTLVIGWSCITLA
ncbi:272_t:CDS:2 [Diversispora eburnea]|uniref:uroporphyrinogen-III C-methyltransferase n=1 Tax=Diversispora eburnea TaxID=1213867 RepID=A0A9N8VMK3_9GLOM|nr:272_t:CDS:2 [Diversispora eburnea]